MPDDQERAPSQARRRPRPIPGAPPLDRSAPAEGLLDPAAQTCDRSVDLTLRPRTLDDYVGQEKGRSEERRVGKEGRSRWSPYHLKKKQKKNISKDKASKPFKRNKKVKTHTTEMYLDDSKRYYSIKKLK